MIEPPLAVDEPFRLAALHSMNILDTPLDERFERITRLAQRVLDVQIVAISLLDAQRQWFKSIQGLDGTQTSRCISFCGHTILSDEIMVVPDAAKDERFADNPLVTGDPRIAFYAGCPLTAHDGSRIGTLCAIDSKPREFSEEDRRALKDLAALVVSELRASMLHSVRDSLVSQIASERREAMLDPLTRLLNRAGLETALDRAFELTLTGGPGAAVIMADFDHFKLINDTFGHPAGDEVLRECAKRMLGAVRQTDAIGRYGGEEFMAVIRFERPDEVHSIAERLRQRVCGTPVQTKAGSIPTTMSLGYALHDPATGTDSEALIRAADAALYHAKHNGRNRVEIATG